MQKGFWLSSIAVLLIIFSSPVSAASTSREASLAHIKQLMNTRQINEAYTLANRMARQEEGNLDFDLLFGSVALEANHPDAAIFALERVLIQQPNNRDAKEKLARAYELLAKNSTKANSTQSFSLGISGGYDSNINSSTTNKLIIVPDTPGGPDYPPLILNLEGNSSETHDGFFNFTGDWQGFYSIPSRHTSGLFWNFNGDYRDNIHHSVFNLNTFNATGGFMMQHGPYILRFPLRAQSMYLHGNRLRRALSMAVSVSRPIINDHHAGMVFIERGRQTYPIPAQNGLSTASNLTGAGWLYLPDNKTQAITRAYYGINEGKYDTPVSKALSSHYYGGQISLSREIVDRNTVFMDIGKQFGTYNAIDPTFLILRKDNFFNFSLKDEWKYDKAFTVVGNYTHYENSSNLPIFQYKRNIVQIGLRYTH